MQSRRLALDLLRSNSQALAFIFVSPEFVSDKDCDAIQQGSNQLCEADDNDPLCNSSMRV